MARAPKAKAAGTVVANASILVDGVHFDEGDEITGVDQVEIDKVVHMGRASIVDGPEPEAAE